MPDIESQPLDAAFCPATWQDVIDGFAPKLTVNFPANDEVIIQSANPTSPDDDQKLWIRTSAAEPMVGHSLVRIDSRWQHVDGKPAFFADGSVVADTITIDTTAYGAGAMSSASQFKGWLFVIRVANTITGATTINIDGTGALALKKDNNTELSAGEIVAGQLIAVMYDPTDGIFELLSPVIEVASATVLEYKSPSSVALPVAAGSAGQVTVATGLTRIDLLNVWLVCTDAGGDAGWSQNDEIDIGAVIWDVGASDYNHHYILQRNGQNLSVIQPKAGSPIIPNKSTGDDDTFTSTKWQFKVCARYFE